MNMSNTAYLSVILQNNELQQQQQASPTLQNCVALRALKASKLFKAVEETLHESHHRLSIPPPVGAASDNETASHQISSIMTSRTPLATSSHDGDETRGAVEDELWREVLHVCERYLNTHCSSARGIRELVVGTTTISDHHAAWMTLWRWLAPAEAPAAISSAVVHLMIRNADGVVKLFLPDAPPFLSLLYGNQLRWLFNVTVTHISSDNRAVADNTPTTTDDTSSTTFAAIEELVGDALEVASSFLVEDVQCFALAYRGGGGVARRGPLLAKIRHCMHLLTEALAEWPEGEALTARLISDVVDRGIEPLARTALQAIATQDDDKLPESELQRKEMISSLATLSAELRGIVGDRLASEMPTLCTLTRLTSL